MRGPGDDGGQLLSWEVTPSEAVKLMAAPALCGLGLIWFAWLVEPDPRASDRFTEPLHALSAEPWGRWALTVLGAYMVGVSILTVVAGFRRVPALRLDRDGISAWTTHRVRRIPWSEVRSVWAMEGRFTLPGCVVIEARGRSVRVSARFLGMTAEEALREFREVAATL